MARHLKTTIINRINAIVSYHAPSPARSVAPARGVRYFVPAECFNTLWGAMNTVKEGRHYRKHIIVRHYPRHKGLFQLYTYHFPKTWSAACVANRELIKEAQRQAHALEHDSSPYALEWRIRFLHHYFRVFKGGEKPEPGLKPYSRFYQYTYVAIYRELQAKQKAASEPQINLDDISFEPIEQRPLRADIIRRSPRTLPIRRYMQPIPELTLPEVEQFIPPNKKPFFVSSVISRGRVTPKGIYATRTVIGSD